MKRKRSNNGIVLPGALMLLLIGMFVAGSLIFVSRQSHPAVTRWEQYDQTLLAAQSAMEKVKATVYDGFKAYHWKSRRWNDLGWVVTNAPTVGANANGKSLGEILGSNVSYVYSNALITASVTCGTVVTNAVSGTLQERVVYVTNTVSAQIGTTTRKIEEVVRYTIKQSSVFNHAYFINNHGWFLGVDCAVNGDIRSNFNVDLSSSKLVLNGWARAARAVGIIRPFKTWPWGTYGSNPKSQFFRPTYNVDQNTKNKASVFPNGYNDAGTVSSDDELIMPYIDNLGDYTEYAVANNGTIKIGSKVVVSNVFNGTGPSGVAGAPDTNCLVLVGTLANPIVINGPVVVNGDVLIKGYYTGQGTIYAGRNIHILDSVIAVHPAKWKQPDTATNFYSTTVSNNMKADFVGLCAKGAIVLGNYQEIDSLSGYLKVDRYAVSASDEDIGYVSSTEHGTNYFDGNYTGTFGQKCGDAVATNGVPRRYYESSLSDAKFLSYGPADEIKQIDGVIYNNHLTVGKLADQSMINGAIVCRDEFLTAAGVTYMNWDPRLAMDGFASFLPPELGPAETILWRELP